KGSKIRYHNHSKKSPKSKHEPIYQEVMERAVAVGVGIKDAAVIDQVNIYESTKLDMLESFVKLRQKPYHLLIYSMKLD
ncbi:ribonuclease HII, partial [Streptococcus suis]